MVRDSWQFARTLRHGCYDIVHLNPSIYPKALVRDGLLLVIAKALRKAVVVFAHGWGDASGHDSSRHWSLFRLVYGRANAFIVLGNDFKKRLRLLGYEGTVFVQSAPIEDELLDDCQRLRRASGHMQKFNILFLARVEKEKGVYEALETYRLLKARYAFLSMTVAGDGSHLDGAVRVASAQRLADVSFVGNVEGGVKYQLFRTADAYLFPSYGEGLPISVLEAMAYGLPIVTRAVGGLRDFFQDGVMGFCTESREPEVFASLLSQLICDSGLRSNISLFNRQYARTHFTSAQVAASLKEVYRFVLAGAD